MASNKDIIDRAQEHYRPSAKYQKNFSPVDMDQHFPCQLVKGESDIVRGIDFLLNDLMALRVDPARSIDWEWRDELWAAVKAANDNLRKAKEEKEAKKLGSSGSSHQISLRDMYQRQQTTGIPRATRQDPIPRALHEQVAAETSSRIPKPQTPVRPALRKKKAATAPHRSRRVSFDVQIEANERRDTSGLQISRPYSSLGQNDDNGQSATVSSKSVRESLALLFNGKGYSKPTNIPMRATFYQKKNSAAGPIPNRNSKSSLNLTGSGIPTRPVTPTQVTLSLSDFSPSSPARTPTRLTNHINTMINTTPDTQNYFGPNPSLQAKRPLQPARGISLNVQSLGKGTLSQRPKQGNMAPPPMPSFLPTGAAARTDSMKGRAYEAAREAALKNASEVGYHRGD